MGAYLKITAGLFLLIQVFHLASLQSSTAPPRGTMNKAWLREFNKNMSASQNEAVEMEADEGTDYYQGTDVTAMEPGNGVSSGIESGYMAVPSEEEENVAGPDEGANETSDDPTAVATTTTPTDVKAEQPELSIATVSPSNATLDRANSSQSSKKENKEDVIDSTLAPQNSTNNLSEQNSTSLPENSTDVQKTTPAPESKATTEESTKKPDRDSGLTTAAESTTTTTATTTTKQEVNKTSTTSSSTTALLSETTETTTTAAATITPEKATKTNKTAAASGSSSERGLATDTKSKRNGAWGAVLGTAVAVALVGLAVYIILKKHQKGFSHRKLVEEYPSEPVHRLENGEPLDLNFGVGGSAYYNPGLQGDNIQMTNFPGRR